MKDKRTFRKILLGPAIIVLLLSQHTLFATPRTIEKSQFYLSGIYDKSLYPEANFMAYPSVLSSLSQSLLLVDLELMQDYSWEQYERMDDTSGALGGLLKEQDFFLTNSIDLFWLSPRANSTYGLGGSFNADWLHKITELNNYEAHTENKIKELQHVPLTFGLKGLWASDHNNSFLHGYLLDYSLRVQKAQFSWITDYTQDPALEYVDFSGDDADEYKHKALVRGNWGLPSENLDANFILSYGFNYIDRNTRYKAVDTDGDGYKNKVMEYADWVVLDTEEGGPELENEDDEITAFDQQDKTFGHRVIIDTMLSFPLADRAALLLSGSYTALDYHVREYYTRKTIGLDEDEGWQSETRSQDWGNFSVQALLAIEPEDSVLHWRVGAGYTRSAKTLTLDGQTAAGGPLYGSLNKWNYPELSLGDEPARGSLIDTDIEPALVLNHQAVLQAGWEWQVTPRTLLFSSIKITAAHKTLFYRAYNKDTQTVWEETIGDLGINWGTLPRAGIAVPLGEKALWVGDITTFTYPGYYSKTFETMPYDLVKNRTTEEGSRDLRQQNRLGFTISMRFLVQP